MPIYEFRCHDCNEIVEMLFTSANEEREMKCTHCDGENLERVLSSANFSMASSRNAPRASASNKSCANGSCSTLEIPGIGD